MIGIPMAATVLFARRNSGSSVEMPENLTHKRIAIAGTATRSARKATEPSPETIGKNRNANATRIAHAVVFTKLASLQA